MDRGAWQAAVLGLQRVEHPLATKTTTTKYEYIYTHVYLYIYVNTYIQTKGWKGGFNLCVFATEVPDASGMSS